jgi:hypothetical protein
LIEIPEVAIGENYDVSYRFLNPNGKTVLEFGPYSGEIRYIRGLL